MGELGYLSWLDAARSIREGSLSPVTYVEALLTRIAQHDAQLNAFLHLTAETALEDAREAENATGSAKPLGPLHGVPFALKDIIDVAGVPTTAHSRILADNVPDRDAHVTARIRDAGGIVLGKLSTHEFALGGPSFDLPWPPARNPWDRRMFPGGSSSGSGAAVAAGFVPVALGSDTGGSVRNPASMCGIVGMKPTYGRVSLKGIVPLSFSLDHIGPMTRTVAENAGLLGVIAGYDAEDPASAKTPVPDFLAAAERGTRDGIGGMRIGVVKHFHREDMVAEASVDASIESALEVLAQLGAEIVELETHPLGEFADCNRTILLSEAYAVHQTWLRERPEDYGALTRERLLPGAFLRAADYVQAVRNRRHFSAAIDLLFERVDVVVTASSMDPPFPMDDLEETARCYGRQARAPFNLTGHPALALPTGFTEATDSAPALPHSMQVVGRHFDEETIYRVAAAYEQATQWTDRHPPLGD